jgi:D-glycero-D-manno-heptose 1,7-bisphosphate phosphatase
LKKNKAVFIDRDGVLIHELGYISKLKKVKLFKCSVSAIRLLKRSGFKVVVVSNQSGVARGYFPESFVKQTHAYLAEKLKRLGARIDAFYYCPHHREACVAKYKKDCDCRKPKQGMIKKAAKKFSLDLKKSFTIGDKLTDVKLGHNGGMKGILVLTGFGRWQRGLIKKEGVRPDHVAKDFYSAARWVVGQEKQETKRLSGQRIETERLSGSGSY